MVSRWDGMWEPRLPAGPSLDSTWCELEYLLSSHSTDGHKTQWKIAHTRHSLSHLIENAAPAQGVRGMRVGGQRKLIVPPQLAYGKKGIGEVPPGATLEFEVTCLTIPKCFVICIAFRPYLQSLPSWKLTDPCSFCACTDFRCTVKSGGAAEYQDKPFWVSDQNRGGMTLYCSAPARDKLAESATMESC